MKHFHFSGKQRQGTLIKGWVLAEDRDDALEQLRSRSVQPYTVAQGPGHIPLKAPVAELLLALRELASLRRSGMAINESVDAVMDAADHAGLKAAWQQVADMLHAGMSLSDAFAAVPDYFPRYAVPLLRLGEANGELAAAITLVADRLDEESKLRSEIRTALAYPSFLLVTCAVVLLFLFTSIIPSFGEMIEGNSSSSMGFLLSISNVLLDYAWLWIGLVIAAAAMGIYGWQTGRLQAAGWRTFKRMPLVRDILEAWEVVQFCSSMARLLPGGVSVLDALNLSAEAIGSEDKRHALNAVADGVRRGGALGASLAEHEVFPRLVIQMVTAGEAAANLPAGLEEVAALYERRMRDGIQRVMSVLEPAVIAIMGGAVGGIMISLLSAIVDMNDIPI